MIKLDVIQIVDLLTSEVLICDNVIKEIIIIIKTKNLKILKLGLLEVFRFLKNLVFLKRLLQP